MSTNFQSSPPQLTHAEQETETAAARLTTQINDALVAVAVHSENDLEALEAAADRLERAARDLVVALREVALQRREAPGDDT